MRALMAIGLMLATSSVANSETGAEQVASVGEPIWSSKPPPSQVEEIVLSERTKGGGFFSSSGTVDIPAGEVLDEIETKTGLRACSRAVTNVIIGHTRACLIDANGDGLFEKYSYNESGKIGDLGKPVKYTRRMRTVGRGTSFEARVIYLGSAAGALNLSYREFKDRIARPAFTEDLTIPLADGFPQRVRFKGIEMLVNGVDGLGLRYNLTVTPPPLDNAGG